MPNLQTEYDAKRNQYLAGEITHHEFYRWLGNSIGITVNHLSQTIKMMLPDSQDKYLNDIPLRLWDNQHPVVRSAATGAGMMSWFLSDSVCVMKARDVKFACQ
jgi:hypothetical protein